MLIKEYHGINSKLERKTQDAPAKFFLLFTEKRDEIRTVSCPALVHEIHARQRRTIIDPANEGMTCADKEMVSLGSGHPQGLTEAASLL